MDTLKLISACAGILLMAATIIYSLWYFERWAHYKLSYENMVKQTVREMVKEEALR